MRTLLLQGNKKFKPPFRHPFQQPFQKPVLQNKPWAPFIQQEAW